jgi:hypothetical protein
VQVAVDEAVRVAKKVIITIPLGEHRELQEKGDEMALANPWVKYREFVPDSVLPHHAHLRVFNSYEDIRPYIRGHKVTCLEEGKADGMAWIGVVLECE